MNISCQRVGTTDTLWMNVEMGKTDRPGTLMVVASMKEQDLTDTLYYPIVQVSNEFDIIVPHENVKGNIDIKAFFTPRIFQVAGVVNSRKITDSLMAFVFSNNNIIFNRVLPIDETKQFHLPSLVFENNASVFFNFANSKKRVKPDISIRQFPTLAEFRDSVFATSLLLTLPDTAIVNGAKSDSAKLFATDPKYKSMAAVTVTAKKKTITDKYKEEYVSALYHSIMEKEFDCLTNDEILGYPDAISFLTSRIPGLQTNMDSAGMGLSYRRETVKAFYIDEIQVDIQQIQILDVGTIALIKYIPPPSFIGAADASGGAVVVYTRRGDYIRQGGEDNNWLFTIKGYTPAEHVLFSSKKW